ncbi:MAG: hypothetical protein COA32_07410 [Fluviicola sp.]|nr:MAG: hypothetical protein COA32_07410 [Fluviicola sp.]
MNSFLKLFLITLSFCFFSLTVNGQSSQTYLTESWVGQGGLLATFYQNHSETDVSGNVYVSGSTINSNNNHDLLLQKFDSRGNLLWENIINGQADMDDMAAKFYLDDQNNIYLTGAMTNTANDDFDLVVLKYDSEGQFLWQCTYDNPNNQGAKDFGVDITGNDQGVIVVTGASEGETSSFDYITIAINESNGNMIWRSSYDYLELDDVASVIKIGSSSVYVSGGSQNSTSPIRWEVATVEYSLSNGNQLNLKRSSGSSTAGLNEINDITINNDNIFLTGRVRNDSTGYDIVTYKLNNQLSLIWEQHFDFNNLDDAGNGIKVDSQGNVIVAGYVADSLEFENYCVLKYDNNGSLLWTKTYNGQYNGNDRAVQLVVDNQDNIFVTGSSMNNANLDYLTIGLDATGSLICEAIFDGVSENNDVPNTITIDNNGNLIVVGQSEHQSGVYKNTTVKYSLFLREKTVVTPSNGDAPYLNNNLILRFDKSKLNLSAIDKKAFVAGDLKSFVDSSFIVEMNNLTSFDWERIPTYKVHRRATTADSLSISRQGDTIRLPDFWASLIVEIPDAFDEQTIADTLKSIFGIHHSQLEFIYQNTDVPNDAFYTLGYQLGLHPNISYPDADIDVAGAWDVIENAGGQKGDHDVKVGIYDHLIDYSHPEFGYSGLLQNSKIIGGRNYLTPTSDITDGNSISATHGTQSAGIIGAYRNDMIGIAGIAGGDISLNESMFTKRGVELYSLGVFYNSWATTSGTIAEALIEGSSNTTSNYGFSLDLANHSYSSVGYPDVEVRDALKVSWRNNTINVAARGNFGHEGNPLEYPACYIDEKWIINVVASGDDGKRKIDGIDSNGPDDSWASSYGKSANNPSPACYVDVMAPGVLNLVSTTINQNNTDPQMSGCDTPLTQNLGNYSCFNGTSAAAPHVTGVAALMYSSHDPGDHWDYKNVLSTEDVEYILEKTTYKTPNQYDHDDGYGLVNAKEAVKQVTRPYTVRHKTFRIWDGDVTHVGTTTNAPNDPITLWNAEDLGIPDWTYMSYGDKYIVEWDVSYTPSGNNEIIDWWEVESRQFGGQAFSSLNNMQFFYKDPPIFDENFTVDLNNNSVSGTVRACYWRFTNSSTQEVYWFPEDPYDIQYTYALHLFDTTPNADLETESKDDDLIVYPNPSSSEITVKNIPLTANVKAINIYDPTGRIVKTVDVNNNSKSINISVEELSNGFYYLQLLGDDYKSSTKFYKN